MYIKQMSCAENHDRFLCRKALLTPWLTLPYAHHAFPYAGCFEVSQLTRRLRQLRFSMKPSWRLLFGLRGLRGPPSWAHLPLHVHTFPFMGTSSPSCAHLSLHGHIFPFMGTSSPSWAHLPLHGHIFPFMGTSSPHLPLPQTWSQVHSVGFALRIAYAELTRSLRNSFNYGLSCKILY